MRQTASFAALLFALGLFVLPASAKAPDGWHTSLKDGVAAAQKSGKPILLITAWARPL